MTRRHWILAAAIACACAACSSPPNPSSTAAAGAATAPAPASSAMHAAGVPAPAGSAADIGIDLSGVDHSVKTGDDFFLFANGAWLKTATMPPDRSSIGTFYQLFVKAEQRTADLIKSAGTSSPQAGSDARKIADYYAAYMDEAAIDKAGLDPLKPALDAIAAIKTRADLARVL
ncbi:MAG: M13 family peptidase, partial [Proteobacteria bacterium]|nr:M13 family peptidase [Pseudomonadota bacterium]